MKEKAYFIPKGSRLFAAAAVCMIVQFAVLAWMSMITFDHKIPFFGDLVGLKLTQKFFAISFLNDFLYFASCALPVAGILLARKNLWLLIIGWICTMLLQLVQLVPPFTILKFSSWILLLGAAACAALVLILVQTGKIRSRKAAVIPFIVCVAAYLVIILPPILRYQHAVFYLYLASVLKPVSCALLMGTMLFKTESVTLPKPIVEEIASEELQ